ncbi:MAG: hypothetical protein HFH82_03995 [Lachnospiraceae bacterium]|nr:hypothetical protein [Lachnospiraceae bacterium]
MKKLSLKNSDNLTVDEAFEDFKGHCQIKNLSGETIKLYQYQFNVFHRFLDDETFLISDVTLAAVNSFILELRSDKHICNDVTINTYLRGLWGPGQMISGDKWSIALLYAKEYDSIDSEYYSDKPSEGNKYLVFYFDVKNISSQNEHFNALNFEGICG